MDLYNFDTICAISSPQGVGAISIIRLTGNKSFDIVVKSLKQPNKFESAEPRKAIFDTILLSKDEVLDEVILIKYNAPHSYTGEDMVEIFCHGSSYIQSEILNIMIKNGASIAQAGEFSKRAFLNNKLDLSQSEAIADLIHSSSREGHRLAINQLKGNISNEIAILRDKMIELISLLELELDFSEEDVEFADRNTLIELSTELNNKILKLINSFKFGNAIKEGIPITIVGKPNTGKSTLLNFLLKDDRAIVSDIPGTTRDSIEETIVMQGIKFRLIDTAGIRESDDEIEKQGVNRTLKKLDKAKIILLLIDATDCLDQNLNFIKEINEYVNSDNFLLVALNKTDIATTKHSKYDKIDNLIEISAKTGKNIDTLCDKMLEYVLSLKTTDTGVIITNARHIELFTKSSEALVRAINSLKQDISGDLISQDLREATYFLGEITGHISNEEVLGAIFSKFCIGK